MGKLLQWSRLQSEAVIANCEKVAIDSLVLQWSRLQSEAVICLRCVDAHRYLRFNGAASNRRR